MNIDLARLGPNARKQILQKLSESKHKPKSGKALPKFRDDFESQGERDFYMGNVYPLLRSGRLTSCELHREFTLYPETEYCNQKLPDAVFKPDFILHYLDGVTEVIEIKSKFTRKKSRDYTLRRRLFIELYARPNGWLWREIITDKEDKKT
ncbi:MAG: DUF1064 domain-containing protein [Angelakisella sp.]